MQLIHILKMQQLAVEAGTLVIAKESSGNDSTLQYLFEEYKHNENSGRCVLSLAFDSGKVNKELKKPEIKFCGEAVH